MFDLYNGSGYDIKESTGVQQTMMQCAFRLQKQLAVNNNKASKEALLLIASTRAKTSTAIDSIHPCCLHVNC